MGGKVIYLTIMCIIALFMLSMYKRCRRPFLTFISVTFMGFLAHAAVCITGSYTGVSIPLNGYTLFCSGTLSVPGVIMMILLGIV